jgi:hypothetical protein
MTLQYVITGGQLRLDKKVFAKEILTPKSSIGRLVKAADSPECRQPSITKSEDIVIINYNDASDVPVDENFFDFFKALKQKYREKLKGTIVIRITALTSYHVVLNLNSDDDQLVYDH